MGDVAAVIGAFAALVSALVALIVQIRGLRSDIVTSVERHMEATQSAINQVTEKYKQ